MVEQKNDGQRREAPRIVYHPPRHSGRSLQTTESIMSSLEPTQRKAGVATPDELKNFVMNAGSRLLIIDVREPDASTTGFPNKSTNYRNMAINIPWNRTTLSMELPAGIDHDTPIITHCSGGGRGQLAKEYLTKNGYTNVMNGGGAKEAECWAEYGHL